MKILMVCLGNICRSPLAQGIMEQKIKERNLNWSVDSAGTGSWHEGEPPDSRSIAVANGHGMDIGQQRARQLKNQDLEVFDIIFAMDYSNYQGIINKCSSAEQRDKVRMILSFVNEGQFVNEVPDPYWNDDGFEQVYTLLDNACTYWVDYLST